jgi:hypothetical protein
MANKFQNEIEIAGILYRIWQRAHTWGSRSGSRNRIAVIHIVGRDVTLVPIFDLIFQSEIENSIS